MPWMYQMFKTEFRQNTTKNGLRGQMENIQMITLKLAPHEIRQRYYPLVLVCYKPET